MPIPDDADLEQQLDAARTIVKRRRKALSEPAK